MSLLKKTFSFFMDCLETVVFAGSIYIVVYIFLFSPTQVIGASMEPSLHSGERLIMSKVSYKLGKPVRGDIVVIKSPNNPDINYRVMLNFSHQI